MAYPSTIDRFTGQSDYKDRIYAQHINEIHESIGNIETELGTDPAGSLTDLKTRLAEVLNDDGRLRYLLPSFDPPKALIVIGFDDGEDDVMDYYTQFQTYGLKLTAWINAASIGAAGFLTWAQVRTLHRAGHEIASHSYSHPYLTQKAYYYDKVYFYDATGPTWTDFTNQVKSPGGQRYPNVAVASGDYWYLGHAYKFSSAQWTIFTAETAAGTVTAEYWNGSTWTAVTKTDNTSGFTRDGSITWTAPGDWATTTLSPDDTARYWMRFSVSAVTTAWYVTRIVSNDLEDQIRLNVETIKANIADTKYKCLTFAAPYGDRNDIVDEMVSKYHLAGRGGGAGKFTGFARSERGPGNRLDAIEMYNIPSYEALETALWAQYQSLSTIAASGTESEIRARAQAMLRLAKQRRELAVLFCHNISGVPAANLGYVLDEISDDSEVLCVTFAQAILLIRERNTPVSGTLWVDKNQHSKDYKIMSFCYPVVAGQTNTVLGGIPTLFLTDTIKIHSACIQGNTYPGAGNSLSLEMYTGEDSATLALGEGDSTTKNENLSIQVRRALSLYFRYTSSVALSVSTLTITIKYTEY